MHGGAESQRVSPLPARGSGAECGRPRTSLSPNLEAEAGFLPSGVPRLPYPTPRTARARGRMGTRVTCSPHKGRDIRGPSVSRPGRLPADTRNSAAR